MSKGKDRYNYEFYNKLSDVKEIADAALVDLYDDLSVEVSDYFDEYDANLREYDANLRFYRAPEDAVVVKVLGAKQGAYNTSYKMNDYEDRIMTFYELLKDTYQYVNVIMCTTCRQNNDGQLPCIFFLKELTCRKEDQFYAVQLKKCQIIEEMFWESEKFYVRNLTFLVK